MAKSTQVDADGFPIVCCLCGRRIVKTKDTGGHRFHYSHVSMLMLRRRVVLSWHVECEKKHGWPEGAGDLGVD